MTQPRPSTPKYFFREPIELSRTGFILMPFNDEFAEVHKAIRASIKAAGLTPQRAGDIYQPGVVMEEVLAGIGAAEVVVADMSQKNPNVFYEVGIAHSFKNNVILLTQDTEDIPFDLRHLQHIRYDPTEAGLHTLTERLRTAILGLQPEPTGGDRPAPAPTPNAMSTGELQSYLRDQLRRCRRDWIDDVVPAQDKVFRKEFIGRIEASQDELKRKAILAESMRALHPAFLAPWQPVEELGLQIIDRGEQECWPQLLQALEQAYALATEPRVRGAHSTVLGHGQLLVLRTWSLWGAYALVCENWKAVAKLLHEPIGFEKSGWDTPAHLPFAKFRGAYVPDAAGSDAGFAQHELAARFLYERPEEAVASLFGDLEEFQASVSLWLLVWELAFLRATGDLLYCGWVFGPTSKIKWLFSRTIRSDFSQAFAQAVFQEDPTSLNSHWRELRDRTWDAFRAGPEYAYKVRGLYLPDYFAT